MPSPAFRIEAAYTFAENHGLATEAAAIRSMVVHPSIGPAAAVRKGHLVRLFEAKGVMDEFVASHWPFRHTQSGVKRYGYYRDQMELNGRWLKEGGPIGGVPDGGESEPEEPARFALEAQLRDFIVANLTKLQVRSRQLRLYRGPSGTSGVEFATPVGRIDILATDQDGAFYVFELKLDRGPDRALGQLARYMGWVKLNLAGGKEVVGVAVANTIDERLRYAACIVPSVVLLEYEIQFSLRDVGPIQVQTVDLSATSPAL